MSCSSLTAHQKNITYPFIIQVVFLEFIFFLGSIGGFIWEYKEFRKFIIFFCFMKRCLFIQNNFFPSNLLNAVSIFFFHGGFISDIIEFFW